MDSQSDSDTPSFYKFNKYLKEDEVGNAMTKFFTLAREINNMIYLNAQSGFEKKNSTKRAAKTSVKEFEEDPSKKKKLQKLQTSQINYPLEVLKLESDILFQQGSQSQYTQFPQNHNQQISDINQPSEKSIQTHKLGSELFLNPPGRIDQDQENQNEEIIQVIKDPFDDRTNMNRTDIEIKTLIDQFCNYVNDRADEKKPTIWSNQADNTNLVMQIVLPRIAYAIGGGLTEVFKRNFILSILHAYGHFFSMVLSSSEYEFNVAIVEVLHTSRALIDTVQACNRSLDHLSKAHSCEIMELVGRKADLFGRAKAFYRNILSQNLATTTIKKAFQSFGHSESEMPLVLKEFEDIVNKVIIVNKDIRTWWGMIGIDCIFIHGDVFELKSEATIIIRLIELFFHEGMHLVQRSLQKDVAYLTPPSKLSTTYHFEEGCCLDHLIWGSYQIKYWTESNAAIAINEERWKKEDSVFTEEEIKKSETREIEPQCIGLSANDPDCIDM